MKYLPLIWAGLWRKPLRTTLTMLALVVAFVLFGLLRGINAGFDTLVADSRMDHIYVQSRYGAPMPMAYKEQIAQMPGVKEVTAQAFMGGTIGGDPKRPFFVGFFDDGAFDFNSQFHLPQSLIAQWRGKRTAIIISKLSAKNWGLKVGDHVTMKSTIPKKDGTENWEFDVIAIIDRDDLPMAEGFSGGNLEYLDEARATGAGNVDQYQVLMSDPNLSIATVKAIDNRYLSSGAPTFSVVEKLMREDNPQSDSIITMVNTIVLSTLFALLLMTSNSLMQSFRERVPELGIMKVVGFSDRQVLGIVLGEAVVQCVVGAVLGLGIARSIIPYVRNLVAGPTSLMTMPLSLMIGGLLVALLMALVSGSVPAWRAGRMQIVDALAGR